MGLGEGQTAALATGPAGEVEGETSLRGLRFISEPGQRVARRRRGARSLDHSSEAPAGCRLEIEQNDRMIDDRRLASWSLRQPPFEVAGVYAPLS